MVNETRRQDVAVNVGESVRAHHHCAVLFIKCVDHRGQGVFVLVNVVAVELHAELTGLGMVCSQIPACAYTDITHNHMYYLRIVAVTFLDDFCGAVG